MRGTCWRTLATAATKSSAGFAMLGPRAPFAPPTLYQFRLYGGRYRSRAGFRKVLGGPLPRQTLSSAWPPPAAEKNLSALAGLSGRWIDRAHSRRPPRDILLDMDSSVSPTHGEQEKSCWNGHCECTCYHPLFLLNPFGDLERCALRPRNVHSADGWEGVLKPVVGALQMPCLAHLLPRRRRLRQS